MSGQTVDEDLYPTFMASMRSSEKNDPVLGGTGWFLHHNNDPTNTAPCSHNFLVKAKLQCFYTYPTALISLQHTCSCS